MGAMLGGEHGPLRDAVIYNGAAALLVAGRVASLREGAKLAAEAIDAGRAKATLRRLVEISNLAVQPTASRG
jgi:anthranilate phosphoribosyltransferase